MGFFCGFSVVVVTCVGDQLRLPNIAVIWQSITLLYRCRPPGDPSLLQPLLLSCSGNVDDAPKRFFSACDQHRQCAMAEAGGNRTSEPLPRFTGKVPTPKLTFFVF